MWGETRQNTNITLMLAGANQKLVLHSLACKHCWGSVGKMGAARQFAPQLLPYLLEMLSRANWSWSYFFFQLSKNVSVLYLYMRPQSHGKLICPTAEILSSWASVSLGMGISKPGLEIGGTA